MRLLFLISIALVLSLVCSAPLDVRVAKEFAPRLHRRQATYAGFANSTAQYVPRQNFASQTGPLPSQTYTSAGWNSNPGIPSTAPGGQQQLVTQAIAQVVNPMQASNPSTETSLMPADKTYSSPAASAPASTSESAANYSSTQVSGGAPASGQPTPQSSVGTYNVAAATPLNTSADMYPVYYVSYPEGLSAQQQFTNPSSKATVSSPKPSLAAMNNAMQSNSDDGYPVYYVGFEEETNTTSEGKTTTNTSSLPASASVNTLMNNRTNTYPVYYVTGYNKGTPEAPKPTINYTSAAAVSQPPHVDNVLVYDVGGPKDAATKKVSKTKVIPNSPISYRVITSTSTSLGVTSSSGGSHPAPPSAPATAAGPSTTQAAASQPAATSYNYPSKEAPVSYQTSIVASPPSTYQQAYNYYGYPSNPPSPATYPPYGAPSPAAYSSPSTAPQPPPSSYSYPSQQGSSAPSQTQSSEFQPVASSNPGTVLAAAEVPSTVPAPAPATSPTVLSGVSSSPPFPPVSQSPSSAGNNKPATSSSDVGGSASSHTSYSPHNNQSSFPKIEPEYENASYIIATPPEKDTVLFLPSPSFPMSPDATQDENSTSDPLHTNSSSVSNSSSPPKNATSVLNTTLPDIPVSAQPANITVPAVIANQSTSSTNSTVLPPSLNTTGSEEESTESPIIMIPENITLPNWELGNTTLNNLTFMSNSSLGPPPTTPASEILISSTTPTAPPSTAAPTTVLPPVVPASNNKTVAGDMLNIPLGQLLNSLADTKPPQMTKPPQSHLFTTAPPKPAPVPGTTKPTPGAFLPITKPREKAKQWGFGDKYLASQNQRARHRNVIFDGIAGDSQSFSNYQVLSHQEVFFPKTGRT